MLAGMRISGGGEAASARVGVFPPMGLLDQGAEAARAYLARVHDAGIDHVCCGDHVSFFVGAGFDGLLQATALAVLNLIPQSPEQDWAIAGPAEVKRLLARI